MSYQFNNRGIYTVTMTAWDNAQAHHFLSGGQPQPGADDQDVVQYIEVQVASDFEPPTFTNITAIHAAAKCGDTVTIKFTASETLSGNPTVTVNGNAVSNLTHNGNDYTCTYTIGDRNHDPAGEATIHISGYDLDGNFGEVTDTEALWIVDCSQGSNCGNGGFTYDRNGNRKTMCDSRGLTVYFYDVMNRLVKVIEPDEKWIAYEYDAAGNRTKMTTHSDGTPSFHHVTQYEYNNRGLLSKVIDQLGGETTYTYKANGLVDTITYPNGTKAVHTYNDRNWLTSISNRKSDDTVIAEFTYSYDPTYWGRNGTRTRVIENILKPDGSRISAQVDYEYDDLYRLVREHRTPYNGGDAGVVYDKYYVYDAAGNRLSLETKDEQGNRLAYIEYTYDAANKMLTAGNSTFTYDDKGNTLTETSGNVTTTYTWDYLNRLTQWAKTGETTQTYVYNGYGIRVRVTPSGGTALSLLLDGPEIAEETTSANAVSYVGPGLIAKIDGATLAIFSADGLGSTRAMSDANQSVVEAGAYDAYGNEAIVVGTSPAFGFGGGYRYYTDATDLHYLKARYYDPAVGRFISRDPMGYDASPNLYAYVHDNPVMFADPSGELAWWVACTIPCGAAIGTPIAAITGCLAGGCADTGTCGECFRQIMCEEKYREIGWWAACLSCLIARWPRIQPKPPMPAPRPEPPTIIKPGDPGWPGAPTNPGPIIKPGDPGWELPPNPIRID